MMTTTFHHSLNAIRYRNRRPDTMLILPSELTTPSYQLPTNQPAIQLYSIISTELIFNYYHHHHHLLLLIFYFKQWSRHHQNYYQAPGDRTNRSAASAASSSSFFPFFLTSASFSPFPFLSLTSFTFPVPLPPFFPSSLSLCTSE